MMERLDEKELNGKRLFECENEYCPYLRFRRIFNSFLNDRSSIAKQCFLKNKKADYVSIFVFDRIGSFNTALSNRNIV